MYRSGRSNKNTGNKINRIDIDYAGRKNDVPIFIAA